MRMLSPFSARRFRPLQSRSLFDEFGDFDRVMDNFLQPMSGEMDEMINFQPMCDINETEDQYMISLDVPGVRKEDLKIEIDNNRLMVSGERQREVRSEDKGPLRSERSYGRFQRIFTLPGQVEAEQIEAHYHDGVLELMVPKAESARSRTIEIQGGNGRESQRLSGEKKEAGSKKGSRAS